MAQHPNLYKQKGSDNWRCRFTLNGVSVNETTGTDNLRDAKVYVRTKMAEVHAGTYTPRANIVTVKEICEAKLVSDKVQGLDSYVTVLGRWTNHLEPFFQGMKAAHISTDLLNRYIAQRQGEGALNSSINRELALLKNAYTLAREAGTIKFSPHFPKRLKEPPARSEFLRDDQYPALSVECAKTGPWLSGMFECAYAFGWRSGSLTSLRVRQVNFAENTIRLESHQTKNDEIVLGHMTKKVREAITICCLGKTGDDFVFTRDGQPIVNYAKA